MRTRHSPRSRRPSPPSWRSPGWPHRQARGGFFRRAKKGPELKPGVYLDGGFGVGKTHLLAAIYHAMPVRRKYFGSFIEYTALVGALGYKNTVDLFRGSDLLCIDEFELDDPGDTMVMTRLLGELVASGTRLAATSNTPPNALGEGRFAAQDFLREIHAMAASFETIRIDGTDYRHRALDGHAAVLSDAEYEKTITDAAETGVVSDDAFAALVSHLATVHPSRYIRLIDGLALVGLRDVSPLTDQSAALRFVAFIDRVYDAAAADPCDRARPSTSSSPRRCSPAATARSISARSRAWWHLPSISGVHRRSGEIGLGLTASGNVMFTSVGVV